MPLKKKTTQKQNQVLGNTGILQNINELRQRLVGNEDHQEIVSDWEAQAKRLLIMNNLQEHEGVKMIIDQVKDDIGKMEHRLKTEKSDALSDTQRDALIDVIAYLTWFVSIFTTTQSELDELSQSVENELESEEDEV